MSPSTCAADLKFRRPSGAVEWELHIKQNRAFTQSFAVSLCFGPRSRGGRLKIADVGIGHPIRSSPFNPATFWTFCEAYKANCGELCDEGNPRPGTIPFFVRLRRSNASLRLRPINVDLEDDNADIVTDALGLVHMSLICFQELQRTTFLKAVRWI